MTELTRLLSLLVLLGAAQAARITLCEDANFRGRCVTLAHGVETLDGEPWELCTDTRFQGRCIEIDRNVTDLSRLDFKDVASSIRPLR